MQPFKAWGHFRTPRKRKGAQLLKLIVVSIKQTFLMNEFRIIIFIPE